MAKHLTLAVLATVAILTLTASLAVTEDSGSEPAGDVIEYIEYIEEGGGVRASHLPGPDF